MSQYVRRVRDATVYESSLGFTSADNIFRVRNQEIVKRIGVLHEMLIQVTSRIFLTFFTANVYTPLTSKTTSQSVTPTFWNFYKSLFVP